MVYLFKTLPKIRIWLPLALMGGLSWLMSCDSKFELKTSPVCRDADPTCQPSDKEALNLRILTQSFISNADEVEVRWEQVDQAISYEVGIYRTSPCEDEVAAFNQFETSKSIGLLKDGKYYICVFANLANSQVEAATNNGIDFTIDRIPPRTNQELSFPSQLGSGGEVQVEASDETALQYSWTQINGPGQITFTPSNGSKTKITATKPGKYQVSVLITDAAGNITKNTYEFSYEDSPSAPLKGTFELASGQDVVKGPSVSYRVSSQSASHYQLCSKTLGNGVDCQGDLLGKTPIASASGELSLAEGFHTIYAQFISEGGQFGEVMADEIIVDNTNPDPPALADPDDYHAGSTLAVQWTKGADSNPYATLVDLCENNDCATSCVGAKTKSGSSVQFANIPDGTYYVCAQSQDLAGNLSSTVFSSSTITIDATPPTAATGLAITESSPHNSDSLTVSFTPGSDAHFSTHNLKACTDSTCTADCVNPTQSATSPVTLSSLLDDESYYACIQTIDLAGNASAWVASATPVAIDLSLPTVLNVTSSTSDGAYGAGQTITVQVQFSEAVQVANGADLGLTLETGPTDRIAAYSGGSGTDTLSFDYTVMATDTSQDLDYVNPTALSLGATGSIQDLAENPATLTLPAPSDPGSLGHNQAIVIDTTNPTPPSGITPSDPSPHNSSTLSLSFTGGSDTNALTYQIKACLDNSCATSCVGLNQDTDTSASVTGLLDGTSYYACVRAEDTAGNLSSWIASTAPVAIDLSNPTVQTVSATTPDGFYRELDPIDITVEFSEVVYVTNPNDLGLTLETGTTDRVAIYQAGDGSNTLTFRYTIAAGDDSSDLDYVDVNSLSVGATGTIRDDAGNDASLTFPSPGATDSLGDNKAIVIDNTAPLDAASVDITESSPHGTTTLSLSFTEGSDGYSFDTHNIKACTDSGCSAGCVGLTQDATSPASVTGLQDGSTYYACVQSVDTAGNTGSFVASGDTLFVDLGPPSVTSVSSTTTNGDYKESDTIEITIQFSEVVNVTNSSDLGLTLETGATDRVATYTGGTGTDTLTFEYTVAATDTSGDLDYLNTTALSVGATGTIRDGALNDATLTLPSPGASGSLGDNKALVIDTTNPTAASTITITDASPHDSSTIAVTFTAGSDTNTVVHNVKACTDSGCSVGCVGENQDTDTTASVTGLLDATDYYACVQAEDAAGNQAAFVASGAVISIDLSGPTVSAVSATTGDGYYRETDTVDVTVQFNEIVFVTNTGDLGLTLETGTTDRVAVYQGGDGTDTLTFRYTVAAGDDSSDLDYVDVNSLSVGATGTIRDDAGNDATLTLPSPGAAGSLGDNKAIVIDNTAPLDASSVDITETSPHGSATLNLTYTDGSDGYSFSTHNIKACTDSGCSSNCVGLTQDATSPASVTGLQDGSTYYACVQSVDTAGNTGSIVASGDTLLVDLASPTVSNVTSTTTNGDYKESDTIEITIQFSEVVHVTNSSDLGLTLETGTTDRVATYTGGTGTDTLTFEYTVAATDTSGDLDYLNTTALSVGATGTIRDGALNDATLTLPSPGASGSLGDNKALVIDTTNPTAASTITITDASPHDSSTIAVTFTAGSDTNTVVHNVKACTDSGCSVGCVGENQDTDTTASVTGLLDATDYYACVQAEDAAGNQAAFVASGSQISIDLTAPTVNHVTATTSNGSYNETDPIDITIEFSEVVQVTNTGDLGLTVETGTTDRVAVYQGGNGTNTLTFRYTVAAGDNNGDLDYVDANALSVGATGTIRDDAGNDATLTLATPGAANSLGNNKAIVVDTTSPNDPNTVAISEGSPHNGTSVTLTFTDGTDSEQFSTHNVKACTNAGCSTSCVGLHQDVASPATVSSLVDGSTYYGCVQSVDAAGNVGSWVASSGSVAIDVTDPNVSAVSSSATNGHYKASDTIEVTVQFSEVVYVTNSGDLGLTLETGSTDRVATYTGGDGTDTLTFEYTVVATDISADLDYVNTTALSLGASGTIKDEADNDASLTLASPGASGSLGNAKAIVIDTTNPTAATTVTISDASPHNSNTIAVTFTAGTDTHTVVHNVKACTNSGCSVGCVGENQDADTTASVTGLLDATDYYACVQAEDTAGNTAAFVASGSQISIDLSAPTVSNVTATTTNGYYNETDTIDITVEFSEIVNVTNSGELGLTLETGTTDRVAVYQTGDGTNTLTFRYTVASGDGTADLDYQATTSLSLGATGTIKDDAGNDASLTLASPGATNSLGDNKALVVDTTNPGAPGSLSISEGSDHNSQTINFTFTNGSDTNFSTHNIKACTNSGCSTGCVGLSTDNASPASVTGLAGGSSYYACAQSEDLAGNQSAWVASSTQVAIDLTDPDVQAVSSTETNGLFGTSDTLELTVQFSEVVFVTNGGDLGLTLETGTTDQVATYTGGSGTDTLTFDYTVQAGDAASDLDYKATTSLSVGASGTIKDAAGNDAVLTLATPGATGSLADAKALVIDTTDPTDPSSVSITESSPSNSSTMNFSFTLGTDANLDTHTVKACTNSGCSIGCVNEHADAASPASVTGLLDGNTYYACVQALDQAGNTSAFVASGSGIVIDLDAPSVSTVTSTTSNGDYKLSDTIEITIQFDEVVYVTNSGDLSLTLETGTNDRTAGYTGGSGSDTLTFEYTVQTGDTTGDLEYKSTSALSLGASGTIRDQAGNNVSLTLPGLGGAGSLGNNKAIVIDTTNPTGASGISITEGSDHKTQTINITFTDGSDTNGISHNIKACTNAGCSANCVGANNVASGGGSITGLVEYSTYYACVETVDDAGNSSGFVASASTVHIDLTAPTSTAITIANYVGSVDTTTVTLTLAASDVNSPIQMYVTNASGCGSGGSWEAYNSSKIWTLGQTDAEATVYVKFRDPAQNESSCINDTIIHDTEAPPAPDLLYAFPGDMSVRLAWPYGGDDALGSFGEEGSYNATALGSPAFVNDGVYGRGIQFDGSSDAIYIDQMPLFSNPWSVSLWFRSSSTGSDQTLFRMRLPGNANLVSLRIPSGSPGYLRLVYEDGSTTTDTTSGTYHDGNWHHAVMVSDGSSINLYLDGNSTPVASISVDGFNRIWTRMSFGGDVDSGPTVGEPSEMDMDEIRVYDEELSTTEVGLLYNQSALSKAPLIYYSFEEENATTISDRKMGYLLVRKEGAAVDWTPVDGTSYDTYDVTELNSCGSYGNLSSCNGDSMCTWVPQGAASYCAGKNRVVYKGDQRQWFDRGLQNKLTYHYKLFTYDEHLNYAASSFVVSARPSIQLATTSRTSCTLKMGAVNCWGYYFGTETIDKSDGSGFVHIGDDEDPLAYGEFLLKGQVRQISASSAYTTCALYTNGQRVQCWGSESNGLRGNGTSTNTSDFMRFEAYAEVISNEERAAGIRVIDVSAAKGKVFVLLSNGRVRAWGNNLNTIGPLGYGTSNMATFTGLGTNDIYGDEAGELPSKLPYVDLGGKVVDIESKADVACAHLETGAVRCWGRNDSGALGLGHASIIGDNETPASQGDINLHATLRAIKITVGDKTNCAKLEDGSFQCWGQHPLRSSAITVGDNETPASAGLADFGTFTPVEVYGGEDHLCAVDASGEVRCFGNNDYGELGYGNTANIATTGQLDSAGDLSLGEPVLHMAMDFEHTCAVTDSDRIHCWGRGDYSRLGIPGISSTYSQSNAANTLSEVKVWPDYQLYGIDEHGLCSTYRGAAKCWGENSHGYFGYGHTNHIGDDEVISTVSPIPVGIDVINIAGSVNNSGISIACFLTVAGKVRCSGSNPSLGYLQDGVANPVGTGAGDSLIEAGDITLISKAEERSGIYAKDIFSTGFVIVCALLSDDRTVRCWGVGVDIHGFTAGTVGDDEAIHSVTTNEFVSDAEYDSGIMIVDADVASGAVCVTLNTGVVRCSGANEAGMLLQGNTTNLPSTVTGDLNIGADVLHVGSAANSFYVITKSGDMKGWGGGGGGRLGNADTVQIGPTETTPVDVELGSTVLSMYGGAQHVCALRSDRQMQCWGTGGRGRLGYGNTANIGDDEYPSSVTDGYGGTPITPVISNTSTEKITAHANSLWTTCAVINDASIRCWGYDGDGNYGTLGPSAVQDIGDDGGEMPPGDLSVW